MLNIGDLNPVVKERIEPFFRDVLTKYGEGNIHSIYITGTAITGDFDIKTSDINSIFLLKEMDIKFLETVAPLGKKYSKNKISAPLVMTPDYIKRSVDVFPIEFLSFKLIHKAVYGSDVFGDIEIHNLDLRHQCERELKAKLIWLRQNYISMLGDTKALGEYFIKSISGYIPLFRGIIKLFNEEPPIRQEEVVVSLSKAVNISTDLFLKILKGKRQKTVIPKEDFKNLFADYYSAIERLGKIVDEIKG
ncbi:MAG: hypothetical protein HY756_08675 [Nitrospirae bacterium]|nr:hypothetical protein [Nitrospirota bacterium]